ncbi:MAG TPA: DNA mismatch repair protein MutS, partial [Cytophagales bacterium]|nr:DNA mismatch repair protein MutS [Cytophagales bacterium]
WLANERLYYPFSLGLLIFIVLFVVLIRKHQSLRRNRDQARIREQINAEELLRLQGKLHDLESGEEFLDAEHPYINDLDVFGSNSLFQLLNHTTTPTGKSTLANWLQKAASPEEIRSRQAVVRELGPKIEERQQWQILGRYHAKEDLNMEGFYQWLEQPNQVLGKSLWNIVRWVLPAISLVLWTAFGLGHLSFGQAGLGLVLNMAVLGRWFNYSLAVQRSADQSIHALKGYEGLLRAIEKYNPQSERLRTLYAPLEVSGTAASKILGQLKVILDRFDSRANLVYILANIFFVLDLHGLWGAERWRSKYKAAVRQWFDVVGEWETLASLAGAHYRHPDWVIPEISETHFQLQTQKLGHPLIPSSKRVANDFTLEKRGTIAVVTGSNMAGKSTFLRTVGVNSVLAYSGASVCADSMTLSVMQLFTSMRTQDNLEESISSFFAELRRIRQLLERLGSHPEPVLFMLDEILKGTNSQDRHRGAAGLVKQLNQEIAMGLISTHDLELGELAEEMEGVVNYSFNSKVEGEDIRFDYLLTDGLCQEFNAAALMSKMGIKVEGRDST